MELGGGREKLDDVIEIANSVKLDTVYFLKGKEGISENEAYWVQECGRRSMAWKAL